MVTWKTAKEKYFSTVKSKSTCTTNVYNNYYDYYYYYYSPSSFCLSKCDSHCESLYICQ